MLTIIGDSLMIAARQERLGDRPDRSHEALPETQSRRRRLRHRSQMRKWLRQTGIL